MQAQFDSHCPDCGDYIDEGDDIYQDVGGDWVCAECAEWLDLIDDPFETSNTPLKGQRNEPSRTTPSRAPGEPGEQSTHGATTSQRRATENARRQWG